MKNKQVEQLRERLKCERKAHEAEVMQLKEVHKEAVDSLQRQIELLEKSGEAYREERGELMRQNWAMEDIFLRLGVQPDPSLPRTFYSKALAMEGEFLNVKTRLHRQYANAERTRFYTEQLKTLHEKTMREAKSVFFKIAREALLLGLKPKGSDKHLRPFWLEHMDAANSAATALTEKCNRFFEKKVAELEKHIRNETEGVAMAAEPAHPIDLGPSPVPTTPQKMKGLTFEEGTGKVLFPNLAAINESELG